MPETYNSSKTAELNSVLNLKLRKSASELRAAFAAGASHDDLEAQKKPSSSAPFTGFWPTPTGTRRQPLTLNTATRTSSTTAMPT